MIILLALSITVFLITACLSGYLAIVSEYLATPWRIVLAFISLAAIIIAVFLLYYGSGNLSNMQNEPIVIKTSEKPQIDTIITTINRVSDTTYVYHIKKNS